MAGGLPPPPTQSPTGSFQWVDWYSKLTLYLNNSSSIPWAVVDKSGSNITDLASKQHSDLQGLQGHSDGYHISAAQYAALPGLVAGSVASFNTRTGAVTLTSGDVTGALTYTPANLVSPTFTGTPVAPTAAAATNTTQIATTAYVKSQNYAPLASPAFTTSVGFNGTAAITKPTVTGSRGGNAALASLLTALANYGLITDSTSA